MDNQRNYTPGGASGQSHATFESQLNSKSFSFAAPPPSSRMGRAAAATGRDAGAAGSGSGSSRAGGSSATISALINGENGAGRSHTPSGELPPLLGTPGNEAGPSGSGPAPKAGRQAGGASEFVKKLYNMLEEDQYKEIVVWGPKGDSFIVKDMNRFTNTILPQHFKHSNFASFVRQLNKYDFHKVKTEAPAGDNPGETQYWEFKHPQFGLNMKGSLENIKRKIASSKKPETPGVGPGPPPLGSAGLPSSGTSADVDLLQRQIAVLTHNQKQIETHMERFAAQYQSLMSDFLGQHRAIAAQDAFTASFLQYMINLECRLNSITNPGESPSFPPSHEAAQLMATYSELSRARYDKYTESTRKAEALGIYAATPPGMQQTGINRPDSADTEQASSDFGKGPPPFDNQAAMGMPRIPSGMQQSSGGLSFAQQQQYPPQPINANNLYMPSARQHMQSQSYQQAQQPTFYNTAVRNSSSISDSPVSEATQDSGGAATRANGVTGSSNGFANFGEIRLAAQTSQQLQPPSATASSFSGPDSYFPAPGGLPIRPSAAITPGAVMISTLNTNFPNRNGSNHAMASGGNAEQGGPDEREASEENLTPGTAGITAANTSKNRDPTFLAEGEDIAAFAAALKGGQSSAAVRSALTAQPLLIRRATYIPGWSVPPRVLLVEDDAVCRNLTTKFLQIFGCTIEVACDGVEAVNKMQSGVYDICMMDVSMPNLDGVSATSLIRQFDAMTPIISMTGNSRPDEVLTYFSHGMNDVLPKPFTKEGMLSMLEKHLLHLKNIHQNPESAPTSGQLDSFDPETFDPMTSENPFVTLGISNEDYLNILNGGTRWSGFTPSPSPGTAGATSGNASTGEAGTPNGIFGLLGKRAQDEENVKEGHKRTRFQEL